MYAVAVEPALVLPCLSCILLKGGSSSAVHYAVHYAVPSLLNNHRRLDNGACITACPKIIPEGRGGGFGGLRAPQTRGKRKGFERRTAMKASLPCKTSLFWEEQQLGFFFKVGFFSLKVRASIKNLPQK